MYSLLEITGISALAVVLEQASVSTQRKHLEMFFVPCGFELDNLDKSIMYSFVLLHTDNRIVCPVTKNQVVLVEARTRVKVTRLLIFQLLKFASTLLKIMDLQKKHYRFLKHIHLII